MVKKAAAITTAIPTIKEGEVVVVRSDDRILPVHKLHLVHAQQFWTTVSYDDGEVLEVARERPATSSNLEEHVESLVLCYTPEGVVPAKATWRKTRAPFAKVAAVALRERDGRWQEITATPVTESRTNRKTGKGYTIVTAHVAPTNHEEARVLSKWVENADAQVEFEQVAAAYEERLRFLDAKVR
jgi:hypothetical protein